MQSGLSYLTVEEYLKFEQDGEIRHEYVAGQIFAMAGASEEHNLIECDRISVWLKSDRHNDIISLKARINNIFCLFDYG